MAKRKTNKNSKIFSRKYAIIVLAVILIAVGFLFGGKLQRLASGMIAAKGSSYFNGGAYDLDKAEKYFKTALFIDPEFSTAHYQLARIYFVKNKLSEAKSEIDQAIKINPEGIRSYYIRGLINGYAKNYPEAIFDFQKFAELAPQGWAGYNDLAWVYYENKEYENAKTAAKKGLEVKSDNPWLLNSLGAAYLALEEYEKAKDIFDKAGQSAEKLSIDEWKRAYPGNDPSSADWGLAEFKANVGTNLDLAYNKISKGAVIAPACAESCQYSCGGCYLCSNCTDGCGIYGGCTYDPSCCDPPPAPAPVNGQCASPPNGGSYCTAPAPACSSGTPSDISGTGPWTWTCTGSNGGSTATCTANKLPDADGVCGASNGSYYCNESQITNKCSVGTASGITLAGSTWSWTCSEQCNGAAVSCSATKLNPINGACGSADGGTFCSGAPTENLCSSGTSSGMTDHGTYGGYTWDCVGQCGGSTDSCSAEGKGSCGWIETNP